MTSARWLADHVFQCSYSAHSFFRVQVIWYNFEPCTLWTWYRVNYWLNTLPPHPVSFSPEMYMIRIKNSEGHFDGKLSILSERITEFSTKDCWIQRYCFYSWLTPIGDDCVGEPAVDACRVMLVTEHNNFEWINEEQSRASASVQGSTLPIELGASPFILSTPIQHAEIASAIGLFGEFMNCKGININRAFINFFLPHALR